MRNSLSSKNMKLSGFWATTADKTGRVASLLSILRKLWIRATKFSRSFWIFVAFCGFEWTLKCKPELLRKNLLGYCTPSPAQHHPICTFAWKPKYCWRISPFFLCSQQRMWSSLNLHSFVKFSLQTLLYRQKIYHPPIEAINFRPANFFTELNVSL